MSKFSNYYYFKCLDKSPRSVETVYLANQIYIVHFDICSLFFLADNDYVDVSTAVGAAVASFIGGVLLTTLIASGVAGAVFCRAKGKFTHEMDPE